MNPATAHMDECPTGRCTPAGYCGDCYNVGVTPSLLVRCPARESGGVQCEAMLTSPDEEHAHFVSDDTIYGGPGLPEFTDHNHEGE